MMWKCFSGGRRRKKNAEDKQMSEFGSGSCYYGEEILVVVRNAGAWMTWTPGVVCVLDPTFSGSPWPRPVLLNLLKPRYSILTALTFQSRRSPLPPIHAHSHWTWRQILSLTLACFTSACLRTNLFPVVTNTGARIPHEWDSDFVAFHFRAIFWIFLLDYASKWFIIIK